MSDNIPVKSDSIPQTSDIIPVKSDDIPQTSDVIPVKSDVNDTANISNLFCSTMTPD